MQLQFNFKIFFTLYFYILLIIFVIELVFIGFILFSKNKSTSTDLFQYYLRNKNFSLFLAFFYVSFFIFGLYILRILNLRRLIDLKFFYFQINPYFLLIYQLNIILLFFLCVILLISIVIIFLFISLIHSYFIKHIHKLFIYYFENNKKNKIFLKLIRINILPNIDIISHLLLEISLSLFIFSDKNYGKKKLKIYHPRYIIKKIIYNKKYPFFVSISPLYVIVYDCIFNNFVLIHLYPYLLFFIPLMLIKRITTFLFRNSIFVNELIWNIYYKKENCIYAVSSTDKKLLEIYFMNNLYSHPEIDTLNEWYLKDNLCFTIDPHGEKGMNSYTNGQGIDLERTSDNKLFKELIMSEEDEGKTEKDREEYHVLVEKFHLKNDNKILIFIN